MEGWVKLHRCLTEKAIWLQSTPEQKVILITLLTMANHKEKQWLWKGEKFEAIAGQFITSIDSLVKKCGIGISKQNVRTALVLFEKLEFLTNESTKTGRLITLVNWQVYQAENESPNIDTNKDLTKSQQRPNKDLTPNKNVIKKECKNDKKYIYSNYSANVDLIETIKSFIEMRKSLKKPMTDRAIEMLLNKLDKLAVSDNEKIEILNQSIMSSWTDIYELKQQKLFTNKKTYSNNPAADAINDFFGGVYGDNQRSVTGTAEESEDAATINVSFSKCED